MSDALTAISHFINSPPGQLAAGGIMAGIVWKFFQRVEAVLTDQTKLEIAVWLLGLQGSTESRGWHAIITSILQFLSGPPHRRVSNQMIVSMIVADLSLVFGIAPIIGSFSNSKAIPALPLQVYFIGLWSLSTMFSMLMLSRIDKMNASCETLAPLYTLWLGLATTLLHCAATFLLYVCCYWVYCRHSTIGCGQPFWKIALDHWPLPYAVLTSLTVSSWTWLSVAGVGSLMAIRKLTIGFDWFNRKFDIEKKPLQSIGLVAGALLAVVYWTVVIVSRVVG